MWGRRSMTSTRSSRTFARRSASTLPAKPAPTISQSYMGSLLRGRDGEDGETRRGALAHGVEHQLVHGAPSLVPGASGQVPVDLGEPRLPGPTEQRLGLAHDFKWRF